MKFSGEWNPQLNILVCEMTGEPHHRDWNYDNMSAGYWRLYWAPHRHFRLILNNVEFSPAPDHMALIPPHTPFNGRCDGKLSQFLIHFTVRAPLDNLRPEIFMIPVTPERRRMIDDSLSELNRDTIDPIRISVLACMLCLSSLLEIPADRRQHYPVDPRVLSAMRRLEERLEIPPTVEELARLAGLNINSFIRLFREHAGFTPQQYGLRKRIEKAGLLLEQTGLSIDEIALQTGFCHRHHFSHCFQRVQGQSPAAYRRKNRASGYPRMTGTATPRLTVSSQPDTAFSSANS